MRTFTMQVTYTWRYPDGVTPEPTICTIGSPAIVVSIPWVLTIWLTEGER